MVDSNSSLLEKYIIAQSKPFGRIRVWSLVVTIFGDAIEPRGKVFRLGALQKITSKIGIESNALRTAMSRLASDGWLERERIGRASYYKPSKMASAENEKAAGTIYNLNAPKWNGDWKFALTVRAEGFDIQERKELHAKGFGFQGRKLAMCPSMLNKLEQIRDIEGVSIFSTSGGTKEKRNAILENMEFQTDCTSQYEEFISTASMLIEDLQKLENLDGLTAIALRSLLVHNWRRIVLKDVNWPHEVRPLNWPGHRAINVIHEIYQKLLPLSEKWLDKIDAVPNGNLPAPIADLRSRFSK